MNGSFFTDIVLLALLDHQHANKPIQFGDPHKAHSDQSPN
jgi:hypothetical protein